METENTKIAPVQETKQLTGIKQVSNFLNSEQIKKKFTEILGKKGVSFISSVLSACNQNELLKKASTSSIYSSAMMAATLDLPINPNLGFAFLIPYAKNVGKPNETVECQFQIAAKGFKQLAIRSGQYQRISDSVVYEGQLVGEDPLEGYKFNWAGRKSDKIIGYVSYFRLNNCFESTFYMTADEIEAHAKRYSQTYKSTNEFVRNQSKWTTDKPAMALKTVTKLNLSKNGPLSVEMQQAILADQAILKEDAEPDYPDNEVIQTHTVIVDSELEDAYAQFQKCATIEKCDELFVKLESPDMKPEIADIYVSRKKEIQDAEKKLADKKAEMKGETKTTLL